MRNTMSPVESPFAMCASSTVALAPTPFAMDPPARPALAAGPVARHHRPPSHEADDGRIREVMREMGDVLVPGGVRALLLRPDRGDVLVHAGDVERCLAMLSAAGFEIDRPESHGPYLAIRHDVPNDVIVRSVGGVCLDEEMLDRAEANVDRTVVTRVLASEDLIVVEALANSEESALRWHDALGLVAGCDLDWEYLAARARRFGPRRVLSLLLYAESTDLPVPATVVEQLFDAVHPRAGRPPHDW